MILSVTLNPCIDQTLFVDGLKPHDTNRIVKIETDAGGNGVTPSRVAVELGGYSIATGFLGGGPGGFVRRVLDIQGVQHDFIETQGVTRTNLSVEDGSGEPPTTFNAKGPHVQDEEWEALLKRVKVLSESASWVALGGSLPQGVPVDAYKVLGDIAKNAGAKLVLDADGEVMRRGLDARPHLIKPNGAEAGRLLGRKVETVEEAVFASEELQQYLDDGGVCVVSLGSEGAVMSCPDGTFIGHGLEVEVKSTIGSGDSMVGAMLMALDRGDSPADALKYGLAAGAATATTSGAEIARKDVFADLLAIARVEPAH